jgi:hypothetical protein
MSEIKINHLKVMQQTSMLKVAGYALKTEDSKIPGENLNTLAASMKFIEQQEKIIELLELYKQLVIKDAQDIENMNTAAMDQDKLIESIFSGGK